MDIGTFIERYHEIGAKGKALADFPQFIFEPDDKGQPRLATRNFHMLAAATHMSLLDLVGQYFDLGDEAMGTLRLDALGRLNFEPPTLE